MVFAAQQTDAIEFFIAIIIIIVVIIYQIRDEKKYKLSSDIANIKIKREKTYVPIVFFILFIITFFVLPLITEQINEFILYLSLVFLGMTISSIFGVICEKIINNKGYPIEENNGFWWGFFLSIIGIIVCALQSPYSLSQNGINQIINQQSAVTPKPASISDQIKEINELKEQGLITEEEFEAKKKQILNI